MKTKMLLAMLVTLLMATSLMISGCGAETKPVGDAGAIDVDKVHTIRIQSLYDAGLYGHDLFVDWTKKMEQASAGRLNIEMLPAGAVVATFDKFDAVSKGVLDGMISLPMYWPGKHALATYLSSFPYGMDCPLQWEVWFYEAGGLELAREEYAKFNMQFIGPIQQGPGFGHSKIPLETIEDWDGLKARYPGGMVADIYEKAGTSVIVLPGGEVYMAMATGVIDKGEFLGHAVNKELGLHEVGKYIIGPGKMHQPCENFALWMNMDAWNELGPDLQVMLELGVRELSWDLFTETAARNQQALDWMINEHGNVYIEVSAEERAKFRLKAIELWREWARDDVALEAVETQILIMRDAGLLDYPGVREEVEKHFPGLLDRPTEWPGLLAR
ncbi:MAG: hypothetical protein LRZ99_02120 [Desulfotomaculum sp.]|nr:hypothetical protein [Desulfotomaculum sp.]